MKLNYFGFICCMALNIDVQADEYVRKKMETLSFGNTVYISNESLFCKTLLPQFYQSRSFDLAWPGQNAHNILNVLEEAKNSGLNPSDYHLSAIKNFVKKTKSAEEKAELDILFSDALLLYASHLLNGKINPETVDSEWKAIRREGDALAFLIKAQESSDLKKEFADLEPDDFRYMELKTSLSNYRQLSESGGWPGIPSGETLKSGMQDSIRVPMLIKRLTMSKDLADATENTFVYTKKIEAAVTSYQKRHGLDADGNLGAATTASLNVSIEERVNQIKINLERFRWLSRDLGEHYVFVNIASFQMDVFYGRGKTFEQKVIVGKAFRKTPVFSSKMSYLVLNPTWTVPPTILFNDILPELRKNPGYLKSKNIRVFQGYGSTAVEVNPFGVDWSSYSQRNFPYTLRQDPGPTNALGLVKFMFPNKYNVYIHDTPSKELFKKSDRAFSSGCIRLENPLDFAGYLLKNDPKWNREKINKTVETAVEQTVNLPKPLNVHILYLTAWSEGGKAHFRKDLYDRDNLVLSALNELPPSL